LIADEFLPQMAQIFKDSLTVNLVVHVSPIGTKYGNNENV